MLYLPFIPNSPNIYDLYILFLQYKWSKWHIDYKLKHSPMFPLYTDTVNLYLLFPSPTANLVYSAKPFSPENL